jgi:hypothetical protein
MAPEKARVPETNAIDLSQISTPAEVSEDTGPLVRLERETLENDQLRAQVFGLQQDTKERKKYAQLFFIASCVWIMIITALLLMQGWSPFGFKLSEPVVLATIGSTTVNILGILYVVANYLFPKRG